jgi:multiple sugar transport system ATP-binding protein
VTHDQVEAMTMGDRVAVLKKGQLQQFASPNELYDRPVNSFVAGFIGSPAMNMLTAPIVSDGVRVGDSVFELERDQLTMLHDAKLDTVTVGIRPEALELSSSSGIEAIVDLVEDLGSESYIYTHAKPGIQLVARCVDRVPAKLADTVQLRRRPDTAVHLFNPDTGERVGK